MLASVTFNWWAIIIAGVVNMILGMVWYSPAAFGKSWMELMKVKEMKPDPTTILGMFVTALVMAFIFTYFVVWSGATTFGAGVVVGSMAALAFVVLTGISATLASGANWKLWAINAGYWVVSLAIMGGILAAIR